MDNGCPSATRWIMVVLAPHDGSGLSWRHTMDQGCPGATRWIRVILIHVRYRRIATVACRSFSKFCRSNEPQSRLSQTDREVRSSNRSYDRNLSALEMKQIFNTLNHIPPFVPRRGIPHKLLDFKLSLNYD